ncbi:MAG: ethylbenzene dehydrogenase-related protein [Phycisphaerae bacterium]
MRMNTGRFNFVMGTGVMIGLVGFLVSCDLVTPPADSCAGVNCAEGETCVGGDCIVVDPCAGVNCAQGETCVNGACIPPAGGAAPTLLGLDADKAMTLPFTAQAAYNDDTMFFHMSWQGDRGDTHDYFRYTDGAWQREGGTRRDAQATIDNDEIRGSTNLNSTIYESRVTFMLDDPNGPNAVEGFGQIGCTLTCHDNSRAMPTWTNADGSVHKYLNDDRPGRLDLWHHRLGRANPIGQSDDQWVGTRVGDEVDSGGGSRHGDAGTGPFATGTPDDAGNPQWVFDPDTTGGLFAFPFEELFTSPLRYFVDESAADLGPNAPNPVGINYADAVAIGYVPSEGDTVPRRRLRQTEGSRGDILAAGTTFTPSDADPLVGRWDSNIQRALDTTNDDDTALADGGLYNIAFAVHAGMVTVRDHYVSFTYTLSLNGGNADIQAVKLSGSGAGNLPDFSDTNQFPVTEINLYLPGIASYEFLVGENAGLEYIDPATGTAVDQNHAGSSGLLTQGLGCRDCHTVTAAETFAPPQPDGFPAGAMETLVPQRGGVFTPTPIPAE